MKSQDTRLIPPTEDHASKGVDERSSERDGAVLIPIPRWKRGIGEHRGTTHMSAWGSMVQSRGIGIVLILCYIFAAPMTAQAQDGAGSLTLCEDQDLMVRILCDPGWEVRKTFGGLRFLIQENGGGEATVSMTKSDEPGLFIEDLTPSALQNAYNYEDQFKYSKLPFARHKAVCVTGHPQSAPQTQLMDYFILNGTNLYRISFSVTPARDFTRYEPLFEQMILSFAFIEPNIPEP